MVHAVSAFYERSGHMSPVAAALAAGLHVATALALFLVSPLNRHDVDTDVGTPIEVTIEQPKPPGAATGPGSGQAPATAAAARHAGRPARTTASAPIGGRDEARAEATDTEGVERAAGCFSSTA